MYFDEPRDPAPVATRLPTGILVSANGLILLFFGILPQSLMSLCIVAIASL